MTNLESETTRRASRVGEPERTASLLQAEQRAARSIRRMRLKAYRRKEEMDRYEALVQAAEDWDQAKALRAFLRATERSLARDGEVPPCAAEWLAWAWAKTEALDPLGAGPKHHQFMRIRRRSNIPDDDLPAFSIFDLR